MKLPGNLKQGLGAALFLCSFAALSAAPPAIPADKLPVERYALYVASNDGGATRETLRYAGTDAERLAKTMSDIGGVKSENSLILVDPSKADIDRAFASFRKTIESGGEKAKRTEFLFYYSGHSDEKSFLLGKESYDYAALKVMLNTVPTDVHVVMLDSCYSGNFVRAKGGSREKPFLMDDSSVVQGHAYLSSSSEDEASQESDAIQASYFTQALVTGLRGAADASGDGKVSLNELYYYAFNDTLSQTERSSVGPQHPAYNITLVGSGDLVLTDIAESESVLYIPKEYQGTYFIRNHSGELVSEINKTMGTEVALALPAGAYTIILVTPTVTMQGSIALERGQRLALDTNAFSAISRTYGRSRGEGDGGNEETGTAERAPESEAGWVPFGVSIVPGTTFRMTEKDNVRVAVGVFIAQNKNINGAQVNTFAGTITEALRGAQVSGFMNTAAGTVSGVQVAGFMNTASAETPQTGIQVAGFMNTANGPIKGNQASCFLNASKGFVRGGQESCFMNTAGDGFKGVQAASFLNISRNVGTGAQISCFINFADEIDGVQIGVINIAKRGSGVPIGMINVIGGGIISPGIFVDSKGNLFIQYQGGIKRFFTTLMIGCPIKQGIDQTYCIAGFGIGTRFEPLPKISVDLEIISKEVVSKDAIDQEQDIAEIPSVRATVNYSFAKHLIVFGSVNADCRIPEYNDGAFAYGNREWSQSFANGRFALYPSVAAGIKF